MPYILSFMKPSKSQCKYLRRKGHDLKPIIFIGGSGLTDNVFSELDGALEHHELLKVRVRVGDRDKRNALLDKLLKRSAATLLQRTGNVALLYRKAKESKLILPKTH
jgi:RNA-binding protein|tara:strand:+ start:90 stop:410 length:321 start_codon:yes stop_codon:yes gene_type:complete